MVTTADIYPILPELVLAIMAMALLMYGVFRGDKSVGSVSWLAVLSLLTVGIIMSFLPESMQSAFAGQFVVDQFARFMKWLVILGSAIAVLMSMNYNEREGITRFEFPVLILFAALGMLLMISANDLISLYVGLELQSLALYVIAAFRRDSTKSSEAGLKYFVLGALSSGMLLYGASMIYGFAGTTRFDTLATLFTGPNADPGVGVVVGLVFLLAGLAFKVSAVPFHMWTPDVYEGAPTPVTAFFAVAPKIAAIALLVRTMVGPFGELFEQWQQIVILISILSMLLGALAAIWQQNLKRLLAYSSIGHVGYALVGLAAGSKEGITGIGVYMAIYLAMNVGTFCCVLSMRRQGLMAEGIDDLAGLARNHPMMAAAMAVFMFSMAGIPPLAGFFGKLYVFLAAVNEGLYTLAIIGVLTSVVGAYYYLRIVKIMYFDEPADAFDKTAGREVGVIMTFAGLFTLLFFVLPSPIVNAATQAAAVLFAGG
ncbi:MAG: NADH-quinone oxidoreductase subunit NuoN [Pseudomonadota bacterium]|nr:NADH-quinone oxidoreductase subunit NuoN [Rhodospirillaceae bacterium]MEE2721997.1 NADH-quinone oxidoreductase subunit NuoN [Pseudomonadota bacterium]